MNEEISKPSNGPLGINLAYFVSEQDKKKAARKNNTKQLTIMDKNASIKANELFLKSGRSMKEIALEMKISQGNLLQYLKGTTPIGHKILARFCDVFNCYPVDIRTEYKNPELETEISLITEKVNRASRLISSLKNIIDSAIINGTSLSGHNEMRDKLALYAKNTAKSDKKKSTFNVDDIKIRNTNDQGFKVSPADIKASEKANELFVKSGLTQGLLAKEMNISQGNLSQYLSGKRAFGIKTMLKFCAVFDCQPGDIRSEFVDIYVDNKLSSLVTKSNEQSEMIEMMISFINQNKEAISVSCDSDISINAVMKKASLSI